MAVNKLDYGGIQITFGIRAATPVINAPRKNLLLVGPAYYVVDVFDSTGAFDSDALLSVPAVLEGSAAMESPGGKLGHIFVNGTDITLSFAAGTWSIGQVVERINSVVSGVEASQESGILTIVTDRSGPTASLRVIGDIATFFKMTAGETVYGYGSYIEQRIGIPFITLPDPQGILNMCVLDATSIDVYANVSGSAFHFDPDTTVERNGYLRPSWKGVLNAAGIPTLVGGYSPFSWGSTILRPWDPQEGAVTKLWAPGDDAYGFVSATPTDSTNAIKLQAVGAKDGVDGAYVTSELGDYHGVQGVLLSFSIQTGTGAGTAVVVTVIGNGITAACQNSATIAGLIAAIEAHAVASKMVNVKLVTGAAASTVLSGYTVAVQVYLGGGVDPISFNGDGAELGGVFKVTGDRNALIYPILLATGDYIDIGFEGGHRARIDFSSGDDIDDVILAINTALGGTYATTLGGGHLAISGGALVDPIYKGMKSSLAIYASNCLNKLFIKPTITDVTPVSTNPMSVTFTMADVPGIAEGDTIQLAGGGSPSIVNRLSVTGPLVTAFLTEPTAAFLPVIGEGPVIPDVDIVSQLSSSSYTSHRHHGKSYRVHSNDRLWSQGTARSSIVSSNTFIATKGDVVAMQQGFAYGALETSEIYGLTDTFPYWYIEARGCEDAARTAYPYPSIIIDDTDDIVTLYQDSIVDSYGRVPVNPSYNLYAGFTALRQDLSPRYRKDRTKISGVADLIDKLDPIAPLENPLGYGAYLAMLASAALYEFYVLAVPTNDVAGYLECVPIMTKYPDWLLVPLTSDPVVSQVFGSFVTTMGLPTNRREAVTFLTSDIPEEEYSSTLGSGANCASNVTGQELTLIFDSAVFSLSAVLSAGGIDPATLTSADGVYIQLSGGGASTAESLRKYLVASVDVDSNTALVKIVFAVTDNTDAYYSTVTPPVVSESDISLYLRGDEIDEDDTDSMLEALQSFAGTFANRRICVMPNDGVDVDHNGVTTRISNYYAAAAVGGYALAHPVEFPFSGYTVPGLLHIYGTDDTFVDLDRITGLWFLQNVDADATPSLVETCRQFTTDTSAVKNSEFSVTSQLDSMALRVRDGLRGWRRKNVGEETMSEQNMQVSAAIEAAIMSREIKGGRIEALENHATLINVHNIIIEAETFTPLGGVFVYIMA